MSEDVSDIDKVPVSDSTITSDGLGSLLGSVGSIFGPAGMPGMPGMMGAGGMPPIDLSSRAESRAISGGPLTSGPVSFGKSETLIYAAVVVLGLLIVFGRKK